MYCGRTEWKLMTPVRSERRTAWQRLTTGTAQYLTGSCLGKHLHVGSCGGVQPEAPHQGLGEDTYMFGFLRRKPVQPLWPIMLLLWTGLSVCPRFTTTVWSQISAVLNCPPSCTWFELFSANSLDTVHEVTICWVCISVFFSLSLLQT